MLHPIVRALVSVVVLLSAALASISAQSTQTNDSWTDVKEPPAGLGYSYDGPSSWSLDNPGKPATPPRTLPPASVMPNASNRRWNAPVVPARPRLHTAFDESLTGVTAASNQEDATLAPQRSTHADSYRPPISDEPVFNGAEGDGPEPSWTESAMAKFNAAKQTVVGGWNWMAIEANDSFGVTNNRPERRRFRPLCPGCGRRHFQRQP